MSLTNEHISKLENCKSRAKKVYENYDEKLKEYIDQQLAEYQKNDNSIKAFSEDEINNLKQSFQAIQSELYSKELYNEFPFEDLWSVMGLAVMADPTGISGIVFGAFNFIFNKFGLFGNTERLFKEIMKAVEKLIDRKLSEERERQCIIRFKQLQSSGDEYFQLSEEFFERNGKKSDINSLISTHIKEMQYEQLLSTIKIQLMIYRDKIYDSLIYFEEESDLINTIGFYILTACQYLCLQRDCVIHGLKWGFGQSDIDDARKKINSYTISFYKIIIKAGWKLSRHVHGEENSKIIGYYLPPYFDAARKFKNADFTLFPVRAQDYRRNIGEVHYNVKDENGSHLLYPGTILGFVQQTNSLAAGFKGLHATNYNLQVQLIVKFEGAKTRSFRIRFHHNIKHQAVWKVNSGSVNEILTFKEGTEQQNRNSYFVYNENLVNPNIGYNESKLITIQNSEMTLICERRVDGGVRTGYAAGSKLYLIELIFDLN